jgi:hypothetical protein
MYTMSNDTLSEPDTVPSSSFGSGLLPVQHLVQALQQSQGHGWIPGIRHLTIK